MADLNRRFADAAFQAVFATPDTLGIRRKGVTEVDDLVNVDGRSARAGAAAWHGARGPDE